jgi:hypothetical protein
MGLSEPILEAHESGLKVYPEGFLYFAQEPEKYLRY